MFTYITNPQVSTHSRPKAAGQMFAKGKVQAEVSTHSRPKAAGFKVVAVATKQQGFNTQPPEGGWLPCNDRLRMCCCFNTQPPEGGWLARIAAISTKCNVSTHSRPKAAGHCTKQDRQACFVSTHSRPKAAGNIVLCRHYQMIVFQHTAARRRLGTNCKSRSASSCFNTQPPEGGWTIKRFHHA